MLFKSSITKEKLQKCYSTEHAEQIATALEKNTKARQDLNKSLKCKKAPTKVSEQNG